MTPFLPQKLDTTQQIEEHGLGGYPNQGCEGPQAYADGSATITEYDPEYAPAEEAGALSADEGWCGSG